MSEYTGRVIPPVEGLHDSGDSLRDALEKLADEWDRWPNTNGHVNKSTWFAQMLRDALRSSPAEPVGVSDEAVEAGQHRTVADVASNIVNQLGDLWEVPVDVRQATNDRCDAFVAGLITKAPLMGATPRPTRDQVAAIWREHTWISDESRCSCGDREIEFMSHHVADAVLALMGGAE